MMRVRTDGGQLSSDAAARHRRDQHRVRPRRRRRHRPAERPVPLDPHRGRARDLAPARGRRAELRPRPAATPRAACSTARWPASSRTRSSTPATSSPRPWPSTSAAPSSATCRASGRRRCPAASTTAPSHEIDDVSFVGVRNAAGEAGYDLWVGGGLSTNPKLAQRIGVFVRPEQVTDVWAACTAIFRDYGYRRQRNHARIKFLMADWGPEKFRQVLQDEYLHLDLPDGPAPAPAEARPARPRRRREAEGRRQRRRLRPAHRPHQRQPADPTIADLADEYGAGPHPDDGAAEDGHPRRARREGRGRWSRPWPQHDLLVRPSAFRRGTMACTGLEFCKLAIVETKQHAQDLYGELEKRLPEFDAPIGDQRQRLPEQLRPLPDRGHRIQGIDGP